MDRKCICGSGNAAALNALLAEYYPFQLSISAFRFSFPFQLSVSSVSTCPSQIFLNFQLHNFRVAMVVGLAIYVYMYVTLMMLPFHWRVWIQSY